MTTAPAAGAPAGATTAEPVVEQTNNFRSPNADAPIVDLDAIEPEVDPVADPEADPVDDPAETDPEDGETAGEDPVRPKKLSGAQRAKAREAKLLSELSARDREIETLKQTQPAAKTAGADEPKPPKEEDFPDYLAFNRALTAYNTKLAYAEERAAERTANATTRQATEARARADAHAERVEAAQDVIEDFDTVMGSMKDVNVRQEVIDEIMGSDSSAVIAYHLAKNPKLLAAMDEMSPRELAREMGRLEASVKLPEAKRATNAPRPLARVNGGASPRSAETDLSAWLKKTYG